MKQKSSLKDRLVGSRYFSFGITLSLFVLLYVVGMMNYRGFMKPQVFCNLLIDNAALIIATIGITFVLLIGGIDISIGSVVALTCMSSAQMLQNTGLPAPAVILIVLAMGAVFGLVQGWLITEFNMQPFIVTLAGMLAFRGILIGITNGTTVSPTSAAMSQIGQSYLADSVGFTFGVIGLLAFVAWQWRGRMRRQALGLASPASTSTVGRQALTAVIVLGAIWLLNDYRGVPTPVLLLALLLLAGMFMATRTAFGRRIYAIGGNLEAARLSGINVERTKLAVFAINGLMVAIAGLILSSRLGAGSPSAGNIAELDAIAACVIGGTSLAGGVGSVAGAVMGAFIMASLDNGMSMMDVPTFWQYIVKGAILLLAVWMDSATKRRA